MDLKPLIDILDVYSEGLIAFATIVLAIATIFLVCATFQLANITKNQDKPWLHFYYKPDEGNLYVKNIGKGAALDVQFRIIEKQIESIKEGFEAIPPNVEIIIFRGISMDNLKEYQINKIRHNPKIQ